MTLVSEPFRTTETGRCPLLFRDYCTSSGRGRFKPLNVKAPLQERTSGDCLQILHTDEDTKAQLAPPSSNEPQHVYLVVFGTPEIIHLDLQVHGEGI